MGNDWVRDFTQKKYSTCSMKNSLPFCGGEIMVEKERVQKEMSFTPPLSFSHPCMICFSTAMTSNNIYQNRKEIIKSDCDTKYLRFSKNLRRYLLAFRVLFLWLFSREQSLVCPDLPLLGPISKSLSQPGERNKRRDRCGKTILRDNHRRCQGGRTRPIHQTEAGEENNFTVAEADHFTCGFIVVAWTEGGGGY